MRKSKFIKKMRCQRAINNLCDGDKIGCPHYHLHSILDDCENKSICSRIQSTDKNIQCVLIRKVLKGKGKAKLKRPIIVKPKKRVKLKRKRKQPDKMPKQKRLKRRIIKSNVINKIKAKKINRNNR